MRGYLWFIYGKHETMIYQRLIEKNEIGYLSVGQDFINTLGNPNLAHSQRL